MLRCLGRKVEAEGGTRQACDCSHPRLKLPLQSLTPTLTQVRKQLGLALAGSGAASRRLGAGAAESVAAATASALGANGTPRPVSRAAEVAQQAAAAAREVAVGRRQADAQRWISAWRSRSRGNKKAAAAAAAQDADDARVAGALDADMDPEQRLAQVGPPSCVAALPMAAICQPAASWRPPGQPASLRPPQAPRHRPLLCCSAGGADAGGRHAAGGARGATAAVLEALERAQRAAEEAASASGALEAAIKQAENNGALPSMDEED